MKLKDRVIVATGAASGIGRACALRFAAEKPAGLVVSDLPSQQAALDSLVKALADEHGVPALAVPADVGVEADVKTVVAQAEQRFGRVDVFFSNAGLIRDGDENARRTPNGT